MNQIVIGLLVLALQGEVSSQSRHERTEDTLPQRTQRHRDAQWLRVSVADSLCVLHPLCVESIDATARTLVHHYSDTPSGRTATGIAYDVQGAGPAVVLISGSNLDRRMWTAEAEWLKERFTVIRYDLRAHGQSETPTTAFDHVDDLFGLLDELRIQQAALIGLSAGSTIALDAALRAPDRITRIVLVAPGISGYVPRNRPEFFPDLIAALQARDFHKAQEVLLASPLFDAPEASRPLVRAMVTENNRLWTVPRELMKPRQPAAERLSDVNTPTLVLVGDRDVDPQREQAEVLARGIRNATLAVVPEGGHLLNLTSPGRFRELVSTFLRPLEPRAGASR
jgi:3-oxoadipate enol-lactonase